MRNAPENVKDLPGAPPAMTYLITGVAGFIGQAIARRLLDEGHRIVGVDNLSGYYDSRIKVGRLTALEASGRMTFHRADISDPIDSIVTKYSIDGIVHMAAIPGVRYSVSDPRLYVKTNVMGTVNVLEAARERGISNIIVASSSSLYAGQPLPFTEGLSCNTPICPYGASKKGVESMAYAYHTLYGLDVAVMRFFTVYGPDGRPDMAPRLFTERIMSGEEITIYGDGRQRRDFTYIDDIVDGCVRAMTVRGYEIINLGSGRPYELLDLIRYIEEFSGREARLMFRPPQPGDMQDTHADIGKARRLLDWEPKWSLQDGVASMVDWHLHKREEVL